MRPVSGEDNKIYGRAYISPSRYYFSSPDGWVTVSGLRASKVRNLGGVLLGEATTAARNSALPIVTKEALSAWATHQAELIASSVKDEEQQALSAEVVLECGGDIGDLKIARWGGEWLSVNELEKKISSESEIFIHFEGEFEYDEDADSVHPKEFHSDFDVSDNVIIVLRHDGGVLSAGNNSWPRTITGQKKPSDSNVAMHIRSAIQRIWGGFEENEEDQVVGFVFGYDITRAVAVFRRVVEEEDI